jgi:hypothetical protein
MLDPVEDQAGPRELQGVKSGMEGGWVGWADGLTVQGEMLERSHAERHGESSGFEWCRVESSPPVQSEHASRSEQLALRSREATRPACVRCLLLVARCQVSVVRSIYYRSCRFGWSRTHRDPSRPTLTLARWTSLAEPPTRFSRYLSRRSASTGSR